LPISDNDAGKEGKIVDAGIEDKIVD